MYPFRVLIMVFASYEYPKFKTFAHQLCEF